MLKFARKTKHGILGYFHIINAKSLLKKNKKDEAVIELKISLRYFPNNFELNLLLAKYEMEKGDWKSALKYWDILFNKRVEKLSYEDYLEYAKAARSNKQYKKAINILEAGYSKHPANKTIVKELADLAFEQGYLKQGIKYQKNYFELETDELPLKEYLKLADSYKGLRLYDDAEKCLKACAKLYPKNDELLFELVDIYILKNDWGLAKELLEKINEVNSSFENEVKISMLYKIMGDHEKSNYLLDDLMKKHARTINEDETGYRKITVFDNGESRIEFYKTLKKTDSIMVTFDSINMEWQDPSFAFKLLMRHDLDILAVRKRKKQTYQQDLTQQDFLGVAASIVSGYEDKMSYGFSLGAYSALYFASLLDCRILALSPRLSIHPIYGRTKIIPKFNMEHNMSFPLNEKISPIIVFDPENSLDRTYINKSILRSFPNATLVKIPYVGHGIAPQLLKMGLLKDFVVDFINGEVPEYDRKKKIYSPVYYMNLGTACLNHNKLRWALQLAKKSLDILPRDKNGIKLMVNVLKRLNKYEEAAKFAEEAVALVPKILDVKLYLIDIYIEMGQLEKAEIEINDALKKFGKKNSIVRRKNTIKKAETK